MFRDVIEWFVYGVVIQFLDLPQPPTLYSLIPTQFLCMIYDFFFLSLYV